MKCPYCGFDSPTQHCQKCFAVIPEEKPKEEEPKEEPVRVRRNKKDKE